MKRTAKPDPLPLPLPEAIAPMHLKIVAAAAALFATLPALTSLAEEPQRGGAIVFAITTDPPNINPDVTTGIPEELTACIIYQALTRIDGEGNVKPLLAKSWTITPDGKTYSFDLVKANWQDGKPFTSEDVKYTLLEVSAKYGPLFQGAGKLIEAIETPASDKVVIKLKESYGPFLLSLACTMNAGILPAHVYAGTDPMKNPATFSTPVGLGPFLLTDWKRGDHLRFGRNPNYWEPGKPYLDEVIAKIIPNAGSRARALQAGEIDFLNYYYFPAADYKIARDDPKLALKPAHVAPGTDFAFVNIHRKPFDDKRVRQALLMATDRDYIRNTVYQGLGDVGIMPFTSQIKWAANHDIDYRKMYPFDYAKANAVLDEVGAKRGADGTRFKVDLVYAADSQELAVVAVALKAMWRNVGVDVTVDAVDSAIAQKRVFVDRDYDLSLQSFTSFGDPAIGIARQYVTGSIGRPNSNASAYSNPEVDDLFNKGQASTDPEVRGVFYTKAQASLAVDLPVLTLHERALSDGMSRLIEGIDDENFTLMWRDAWRRKN